MIKYFSLSVLPAALAQNGAFFVQENLNLRNYAPNLLDEIVRSTGVLADNQAMSIHTHGCWCARLDSSAYLEILGGPDPVDDLDQICKAWISMRNCNDRLKSGACFAGDSENHLENSQYTFNYGATNFTIADNALYYNGFNHCSSESNCGYTTCAIDTYFAYKISDFLASYPTWEHVQIYQEDICRPSTTSNSPYVDRVCIGTADYQFIKPFIPKGTGLTLTKPTLRSAIEIDTNYCRCANGNPQISDMCPENYDFCATCNEGYNLTQLKPFIWICEQEELDAGRKKQESSDRKIAFCWTFFVIVFDHNF